MRPRSRRATAPAAILLGLVPLAYTACGFVPRQTLAPTRLFVGVAPWADRELVSSVRSRAGPSNPVLLDPVSQMLPWSRAARDHLLINTAQGAGAALLGNGQSAVLFPTEILSRLLAPFRAVTYSQAARLLVATWGVFLLARLLGFGEVAACAASLVFIGSGFVQLWRLHPHSLVAAMAPWIIAGAIALWRRPGPRSSALLAVAGAVTVAAGHPETLLHVALFTLVALSAIVRFESSHERTTSGDTEPGRSSDQVSGSGYRPNLRPRLVWSLACATLATFLAAPALLPFLDNLRVSAEWIDRRPHGRTHVEGPLRDALERLRPAGALHALGDPLEGTWRGPENLAELGGAATGGAALFLAVFGLIGPASRSGRRLASWSIAAIGAIGLLVGAHTPIVSAPFGWAPLLGDSLLKRLSLWWVLAVVLLAAAGTESILDATRHKKRALLPLTVAAILPALAIVYLAITSPATERSRFWSLEVAPIAVALTGATIAAGHPSRSRRFVAGVVVLFTALLAPRVALLHDWIPTAPPEAFYFGTRAHQFLRDRLQALPPHGWRVTGLEAALPPHSGAFQSLEEIRTYDPMAFSPYERFIHEVAAPPLGAWSRVLVPFAPSLAFLGVRYVVEDPPPPLPVNRGDAANFLAELNRRRRQFRSSGLALVYDDTDAVIWERRDALPRAFFPGAWRVAAPERALEEAATIADYTAMTIVDRSPAASSSTDPTLGANAEERSAPSARVLALDVARGAIRAEVESDAVHLLATSQPAIPGWRVELDGERAPDRLRRVNTAFLGVAVPPGRHRVDLVYAPFSWRFGLLLASLGAIAAMALMIAGRARGPRW